MLRGAVEHRPGRVDPDDRSARLHDRSDASLEIHSTTTDIEHPIAGASTRQPVQAIPDPNPLAEEPDVGEQFIAAGMGDHPAGAVAAVAMRK